MCVSSRVSNRVSERVSAFVFGVHHIVWVYLFVIAVHCVLSGRAFDDF